MIALEHARLIDIGWARLVYALPGDDSKVCKVHKATRTPDVMRASAWHKRLLPLAAFDQNRRDLLEYRRACERSPDAARHICKVFGIEATTRGPGLVAEYVRDEDGRTSPTLMRYVQTKGLSGVEALIDDLFEVFAQHHILFRDAHAWNILVQQRATGPRLVVIEGLGEGNAIPYSSVSKVLNARKLVRKKLRMKKRLIESSEAGGAEPHRSLI